MSRGRIRQWLARFRAMPNRVAGLEAASQANAHAVARLETEVGRLHQVQLDLDALRAQHAASQAQAEAVEPLIARAGYEARVAVEAGLAPQRDAAVSELVAGIASTESLRSGLSVFIITWNHAGYLAEAIASARATLATLDPDLRGDILILDDASTDNTAEVLAGLSGGGDLRIVRAPTNLGLARARNVLLHACTTTHAVHLDADNSLFPHGAAAVFHTAQRFGCVITGAQVLASTDDGTEHLLMARAPSARTLLDGSAYDTMSVIDVAQVLESGGYDRDPGLIGSADDFDLLLRCLRQGRSVGFVPVVIGRYRLNPFRNSAQLPDVRFRNARIRRKHLVDEPDVQEWMWFVAHPELGFLYGSNAATAQLAGPLASPESQPGERSLDDPTVRSVLVLSSGGVGNLGDDAITAAVVERLISVGQVEVSMISDGGAPIRAGAAAPWLGRISDVWRGLSDQQVKEMRAEADSLAVRNPDVLIPHHSGPAVLDIEEFDVVVVAGGGNLASPFAEGLLVPRVAIALVASARGIPVIWSGQGVGPCTDDELDLVRAAARTSAAFACRDRGSVALVNGSADTSAVLVGDDAMHQRALPADGVRQALCAAGVPAGPIVVFHVRETGYGGGEIDADLAEAVDTYAAECGATVLGLIVYAHEQAEIGAFVRLGQATKRRAPWRAIDVSASPELAVGLLRVADAVVAHSYHLALWSLMGCTPTLLAAGSDYYRAKAGGLSELAGFPGSIALEGDPVTAQGLATRLAEVERWLEQSELECVSSRVDGWLAERIADLAVRTDRRAEAVRSVRPNTG